MSGAKIFCADPQAFAEADVGWVFDRFGYRTPEGLETPFRVSATFVLRSGRWRLVLWHDSVPVANEQAIGVRIPI